MNKFDLDNLPFAPALEANSPSQKKQSEVETEEDGERAGKLRLLRMLHQSKTFMAQTQELLPLPSDTPETKA